MTGESIPTKDKELPFCGCGCGDRVSKKGNKFIRGHNGRVMSDETRDKIRKTLVKYFDDPEIRSQMSKRTTEQWENPELREKTISGQLKGWENPISHENASRAQKKRFKDPEELEKMIKRSIKQWEDPLIRDKQSKGRLKYFKYHPERGESHSIYMKQRFKDHPDIGKRHSAFMQGQDYNAGEWTGYTDKLRSHLISANQCIHLNPWFEGCNQHHIMSGVIINIPVSLHRSIWHQMPNGEKISINIKEINELAFNYLLYGL